MRLDALARHLAETPSVKERLQLSSAPTSWAQIAPEARPLFVAALYQQAPRPLLIVTPNYERALQWQARLALYGVRDTRLLPSGLASLYEDSAPESVALSDRIGALRALVSGEPAVVIATPLATLERTLPDDILRESFLEIRVGQESDVVDAAERLKKLGYEPADPVRVPGQYSKRGGILDVYPTGHERPVRIEFFGDLVEGIRTFDPNTQRSIAPQQELIVAPTRETLVPTPESGVVEMVEQALAMESDKLEPAQAKNLEEYVRGDIKAMQQRVFFDRLDLYRPLIQPESACAIDLLADNGLVVLDEALEIDAVALRGEEELEHSLDARERRGEILHTTVLDFVLPPSHLGSREQTLSMEAMGGQPNWFRAEHEIVWNAKGLHSYRAQPAALTQALTNWLEAGIAIVLATDQPMRAKSMLAQVELFPSTEDEVKGLTQADGNPAGGFIMEDDEFALVTDHELFGVGRLKLPQRKFSEGVPITTVLDLKPGDYVVHINFGIGVFAGLVTRVMDGLEKEFLLIEYKAPDRLFVPADQLDRVQKYLAPGDQPPKINRLSGGDWQKAVGKAREEAREFARDLIRLYAERIAVKRESYGPDSPWQSEMEHTFPWVETPSQMQAIIDAKEDLENDYPMDRLVCGDVGFGKTEVAIRAAFKVAQAGKQVVVLCPTTILSEQHYRSFAERLSAFPTRLALLNRFVTGKDRKEILAAVESGEVDILVGTHALLSTTVQFNDLGLLIIDEEQKFGVKHKEALKKLRVNVDVLSMSATPIPRTLSMAMMNIRQMSLINDPPPGRLPVRTFVRPMATDVVREAMLRELARGGQVYYVAHRIEGIYHIAEKLKQLVPTAKIAVAHGQMHEKELEPVMVGFIRGEIDILISTTIVENGLDIPNANTLIVENADMFGLSQLYQLRGRVGRSDRQAYAYLLYKGSKALTENATARLQSLAELSHLGAGYSLAFRDLQIRGAGDILGAKQSGQMMAIGYDLYAQLIESEVQFLKTYADGERPDGLADPLAGLEPLPSFDLPVVALIPSSYIEDQAQRLYYYKQLMTSRDDAQLLETEKEMVDRYGPLPTEVERAARIMAVRMTARSLGIEKVDGNQGRLSVTFRASRMPHPRALSRVQERRREVYMAQDRLVWPFEGDPVEAAEKMVGALKDAVAQVEAARAAMAQ